MTTTNTTLPFNPEDILHEWLEGGCAPLAFYAGSRAAQLVQRLNSEKVRIDKELDRALAGLRQTYPDPTNQEYLAQRKLLKETYVNPWRDLEVLRRNRNGEPLTRGGANGDVVILRKKRGWDGLEKLGEGELKRILEGEVE